ncbi:hypothetical protein M8C21_026520 [Ambrosia artemisiifolia]|uniref:Uncharacterized protein n=1 Tax=Ambrosia artemisiifolia TaxID=4212 RepID=A0AAD5CI82_AMBAR|nr:hypothetical protein M8C21_026520 [Ambrosia artemisiifolia]
MSILYHLWDDTFAGPPPDKGLGKLRKQSVFSFQSSETGNGSHAMTNLAATVASPARSTPPVSSFSGAGPEAFAYSKKSASDGFESASGNGSWRPRAPYDL